MVGAHADPALVVGKVVNAVGVGAPEIGNVEVMQALCLGVAF